MNRPLDLQKKELRKILKENVYQFLLYFDKLYDNDKLTKRETQFVEYVRKKR